MMCLVVYQKLRSLEAFGCKCLYIETIYWLPMTAICIYTFNCWVPSDCQYVIKLSVTQASTIFRLTFSANKQLYSYVLPSGLYWQFWYSKEIVTRTLSNHGNEHQQCVNDFRSCESDNQLEAMVAVTHIWSIGLLHGQKCQRQYRYYLSKICVHGASTLFVLVPWISKQLCDDIKL